MSNIEHSDPLAEAVEDAIRELETLTRANFGLVTLNVRIKLQAALSQHQGAVDLLDEAMDLLVAARDRGVGSSAWRHRIMGLEIRRDRFNEGQ